MIRITLTNHLTIAMRLRLVTGENTVQMIDAACYFNLEMMSRAVDGCLI